MPELPEVETIRILLHKYLIGHIVEGVTVNWQKTFPEGKEKIIGVTITGVRRVGKVLIIDFDNGYSLAVHIKMTGQFIYRGPNLKKNPQLSPKITGGVPGKHTHVVFKLKVSHFAPADAKAVADKEASRDKQNEKLKVKEGYLYYNDVRKFGWMKVVKSTDLKSIAILGAMGPEPLFGLDIETFLQILKKSTQKIKVVLMDQAKIGGVGNIYANDALYLAKINPERKANSLSKKEGKNLLHAIEEVLSRGIKAGGASENSFVTPDGTEGNYQDIALVYGKKGDKCSRCGSEILKMQLGGRGTYFCPGCQK